jgi:phytoene dehydrogenase-like protein
LVVRVVRADGPVVVVGAGHNGLVCAAYLARAGLPVVVLEASDDVGGCAATVEAVGTRVNVCNCDHIFVRATAIPEELDLATHGLRYLDPDPDQLSLGWDPEQRPWLHHPSVTRTLDGLRRTHPHEVEGYARYLHAAIPVAGLLVELASAPPTPRHVLHGLSERHGRGLRHLVEWSRRSVASVLRDFFTDEALLAPAVATGPAVWGLSPESPGTGAGALGYAMKHLVAPGRPVGGSGALPAALRSAVEAAGGTVRTGAVVERLQVERAGVRAVVLAGGEEVAARAVVAACDPQAVFVHWLAGGVPAGLERAWRRRELPEGYESKIDARISVLPRYRRLPASLDDADPLVPTGIVAPTLAGMDAAWRAAREGRVADDPILFVNVPSALDASMRTPATDGTADHVFSLEVLYTPWALVGGWAGSREPARWLERFATLCEPGFLDGVRDWRVMDPPAYERQLRMPKGWAASFSGTPMSALLGRRDRELTRYETPVPGLFLTGAATYPGAGIWGASGRNAARVVMRRLDRPRSRFARPLRRLA